jgi:hypothetical protein
VVGWAHGGDPGADFKVSCEFQLADICGVSVWIVETTAEDDVCKADALGGLSQN